MNRSYLLLAALLVAVPLAAQDPARERAERAERAEREAEARRERAEQERERARQRAREREERRRAHENLDDHDDSDDRDFRSVIDTTVAFARDGRVDLSLVSGEIRVTGWNQDRVKVLARSERGLLRFDHTTSRLSLEVRSQRGRMGDTRYELSVPHGSTVMMRSVSGEIYARLVRGPVEAHSVSGDIDVADAAGTRINSVSGEVTVGNVAGNLRANAVSGDLTVTNVSGDVEAETVSGEIRLDDVRSKFVRAETVSGEVEFSGPIDAAGRYDFHAHSGDIRLNFANAVNATFNVETFSGSLDSDFRIQLDPGDYPAGVSRPKRFSFKVGNGAARITTETFSGDIILNAPSGAR
ncbi:MAG TPA: DUF4097 family beta strand repeat-containing protein [Gemmatimonadaceae bacterium]|nr:DUF4097 family beta strand repeat-containing protein [Gemmatimonadaceae bacterium]